MGGTRVARRRVNWRKNSSESWLGEEKRQMMVQILVKIANFANC
jgi:hypothetical protein